MVQCNNSIGSYFQRAYGLIFEYIVDLVVPETFYSFDYGKSYYDELREFLSYDRYQLVYFNYDK